MKKRLGLYVTYDKDGVLADYIIYCLKEYRKIVDELIVISNSELSADSKKKIGFADRIYERANEGFDVGAFADTITHLYGWDEVYKFDEIVFTNDSIIGPLYSMEYLFKEMDDEPDIDFWGLTTRAKSNFDGGEKIYPEHIQSYFYVVESRMLHSAEFRDYWENITSRVTDFRSAITNYEFDFTSHFEKLGFKWKVLVKLPGYYTDNPAINLSPYHYNTYELVKSGRYPFIKRKLFTGDFIFSNYSDKSDLRRAFDYVREQTDYDINLIWDYILKNCELGSIIRSLCLYEHISSANDTDETLEGDRTYKIIDLKESVFELESITEKYVLLLLQEKNKDTPRALQDSKSFAVTENMMRDEGYITNVIKLFEKNQRLGVLIPPVNTFGEISASIEKRWYNKEDAQKLYKKLRLNVPFSPEKAPVHQICALWCRKEVLTVLEDDHILENMDGTILQMLPLIAQNAGYYTEIIENADYAKFQLFSMQELVQNLWKLLGLNEPDNLTIEECETKIIQKKIKAALCEESEVYIYGAGERAFRVISAIRSFADIKGIVVSDRGGNPSKLLGYTVESMAEFKWDNPDTLVVVTVGEKYRKDVYVNLMSKGLKNIIYV